jgi:hypothetical protein
MKANKSVSFHATREGGVINYNYAKVRLALLNDPAIYSVIHNDSPTKAIYTVTGLGQTKAALLSE